jgi:hypothetical protein
LTTSNSKSGVFAFALGDNDDGVARTATKKETVASGGVRAALDDSEIA